ncbi:MAG TPA: exopolysaccharide biosynthesis polyprenyl glycosylphosphotransferase [Caulobacteraceae bacterium]|nr:exopolysaccharide biosynthesis polyprenyl glycosylphosphotransferase [Caulobacteraceae bacterium]
MAVGLSFRPWVVFRFGPGAPAAGAPYVGPERRGALRPSALAPSRSRLTDLSACLLFRFGDGAALLAVAAAQAWSAWPDTAGVAVAAAGALALAWSLAAASLYRLGARARIVDRWTRALAGFFLGALLMDIVLRALARDYLVWSLSWLALDLPLVLLLQLLWQARTNAWRRAGRLTPNIAIVGATAGAARLLERLTRTGEAAVIGVFDDRAGRVPRRIAGVPVLGDVDALLAHRLLPWVDRLVIAVPSRAHARVRQLLERLSELPNEIMLLIDAGGAAATEAAAQRLDRDVLARIAGVPSDWRRALAKRAFDLVVGSLALAAATPVMAAIAVAIRLESPGPVFFRQRRHGFNNEEFAVLKFRSMRAEAEDSCAARQVSADDDRITRVGRFIRRTSLDELPQLLNVLTGEMSLVGPRPHAVGMRTGESESARLVAGYAHRHRIKPGMTGWAAIHGSRGPVATAAEVARRVALDVEYIERQSLWLDLWIVLATLPCLLGDRGAVR